MLNINKYNKNLPCQTGTNMYLCTVFSAEYTKKTDVTRWLYGNNAYLCSLK